MDGILGIVSEYNPFHNGHLHHLEVSKQITKTDFSVVVMSGNFVQRGDTSLINKWVKTEMALKAGIDLVIELPTVYAISSAENFADGAIKILNSLGVVDFVSFGSEIGEITPLNDIANILYREPKEFSSLITAQLKSGLSFPRAREIAINQFFGTSKKYSEILAELFVIDFYDLNSKVTNTDVGGLDFVFEDIKEEFNLAAEDTLYKYIESDVYGERTQELPTVTNTKVTSSTTISFESERVSDENAYEVEVEISYNKDLGYPTKVNITLVHCDNKLCIVEVK